MTSSTLIDKRKCIIKNYDNFTLHTILIKKLTKFLNVVSSCPDDINAMLNVGDPSKCLPTFLVTAVEMPPLFVLPVHLVSVF